MLVYFHDREHYNSETGTRLSAYNLIYRKQAERLSLFFVVAFALVFFSLLNSIVFILTILFLFLFHLHLTAVIPVSSSLTLWSPPLHHKILLLICSKMQASLGYQQSTEYQVAVRHGSSPPLLYISGQDNSI